MDNNIPNSNQHSNLNNNNYNKKDEVVGIGTWIGVMILIAIPIVNIIAYIVMAVTDINQNLKNFARAGLVIMIIVFVLVFGLASCGSMFMDM